MHHLRAIIFISVPAFGVVLLALEGFLRISGYVPYYLEKRTFIPSEDPRILYELNPGFSGLYAGVPVSIGPLGTRGSFDTSASDATIYRVAIAGDSIAFGQGVHDHETLAARLRPLLRERSSSGADVVNLGVPGYNTCQEYWYIQKVSKNIDLDAIVLLYSDNDVDPAVFSIKGDHVITPDIRTGGFHDFMAKLRKLSYVYNLAWSRWQILKRRSLSMEIYQDIINNKYSEQAIGWEKSKNCLKNILSFAEKESIRIIVIPFPILSYLSHIPYPFQRYIDTICQAVRLGGGECMDVLPLLRDPNLDIVVSVVDPHPSSDVYSRIAAELARVLK